ncbi:uncharacterized protein MYCFIDRAFT_172884 [Pseudocercospora fijiensis CIRAD86]|uniref:Uncharacterized protein n=1 Tax=Pseudocercospora fijiensis (strain CIRAD86) TaxID=383855 RepID=M2Z1W9_PSEFD|nr:uncharacterized protein MYCFIDRAFT_172884 [Pseudocercospora fijiensis CIRAD86]EME83805.1 hypothetical protein MYCFIDRAFT_172884 [Pseudocercospora fijiensis CIRAD86]
MPKTIAPVFGGVSINAFNQHQSTDAADMATYCFIMQGDIMDSWLELRYKPIWWAAFFQHPLVYHSLSFSCGVLQDNVSSSSNDSVGQYSTQLDTLDTVDIEPILLAMLTLSQGGATFILATYARTEVGSYSRELGKRRVACCRFAAPGAAKWRIIKFQDLGRSSIHTIRGFRLSTAASSTRSVEND